MMTAAAVATAISLTRRTGRAVAAVLLIVAAAWAGYASTAADYKVRIDASREIVDDLLLDPDNAGSVAARAAVASITRKVPDSERVEWPGGSVETDNKWLSAKVGEFEQAKLESDRVAVLTEISERLAAISQFTGECVAAAQNLTSKDEEKQKLNEILKRSEYQKPKPENESLFRRWYRAIVEWLEGLMPDRPDAPVSTPTDFSVLRVVLQILIFGIAAAIIGFLLFRLVPVLRGRFASRERREREDRVIFGERIADDQSSSDLFREAEQLAASGDLRAAIRKGYIALLCDLSDRRILRLSRHKTNRDYVRDTRSHGEIHSRVQQLTTAFETNWYGLRSAEPADWESFKIGYKEAVAAAGRK